MRQRDAKPYHLPLQDNSPFLQGGNNGFYSAKRLFIIYNITTFFLFFNSFYKFPSNNGGLIRKNRP